MYLIFEIFVFIDIDLNLLTRIHNTNKKKLSKKNPTPPPQYLGGG